MEIEEEYLPTDSMRFHLLKAGDGDDLLVFLHGFPDAATSMVPLLKKAASAGYRAVAPSMRGYGESGSPADGNYHISALARDCIEIIDGLGRDEATVVGHDWGAVAGYAAANRSPGRLSKLVTLSVPPMKVFLKNYFRHPEQLYRSWYIFFFQLPFLPGSVLSRNDFEMIETLWHQWSPHWNPPGEFLERVKRVFRTEGTPQAALGYYRALFRGFFSDRRNHGKSRELSFAPIQVPSLILTGEADQCVLPGSFFGLEQAYETDYQFHELENVGHFPHLEATDDVFDRIDSFLDG